jgi:hypothetical protein
MIIIGNMQGMRTEFNTGKFYQFIFFLPAFFSLLDDDLNFYLPFIVTKSYNNLQKFKWINIQFLAYPNNILHKCVGIAIHTTQAM